MKLIFLSTIVAVAAFLTFRLGTMADTLFDDRPADAPKLVWSTEPPHSVKPQAIDWSLDNATANPPAGSTSADLSNAADASGGGTTVARLVKEDGKSSGEIQPATAEPPFPGNMGTPNPQEAAHAPGLTWTARPPLHLKPATAAGTHGYSPAQIMAAYNFTGMPGTGAGQKIAIIDAYGSATIQNDLNTFCTQFGLAKTAVSIFYPGGKPAGSDSGWALETSLDVEWAHAIAPGAQIILVVARSDSFSDLLVAVDYAVSMGANEVSMSWGGSEWSGETYFDSHFNKPNVSFTASAGDSGAGVIWPAASPRVIGVGGTTLSLNAQGAVISEKAWDGSGGGVSAYETRPSFQNLWNTKSGRGVPDVSYVADPNTGVAVYMTRNPYSSSGWVVLGGTSVGAPQWAALIAIAAGYHGFSGGNTALSSLYTLGSAGYSYFFRDVTQGNDGGNSAGPKYDLVTGLGSPLANAIALYLGKN